MKNDTDISEYIEKCRERLSRLCMNLCRDQHDAADLFQDTCLRAVKYFKSYDSRTDFERWIFKICVNTYKSGLRHLYRMRTISFSTEEEHDEFFSMIPETEDTSVKEEYRELLNAVNRLSEKYRTVMVLRYFNDCTEKETANMLGLPVGTVKSRLNRAKEILRKELNHEGKND